MDVAGNSKLCLLDPENGNIEMNFSAHNHHIKCFHNDIDKIVIATDEVIYLSGIKIPYLIDELSSDLNEEGSLLSMPPSPVDSSSSETSNCTWE
nr:4370_t:CDS:2 [Entrophospora candida]